MKAIGLMSGTSMDGVDVAMIETDGERVLRRFNGLARPYTSQERELIEQAVDAARDMTDRGRRHGVVSEAEMAITMAHAYAVLAFMREASLDDNHVAVIGFHGQTVLHRPERGLTVQLGDGILLAEMLGTEVVYDFRAADVAAGGQGAPFVPAYHRALVREARLGLPVAVVNIGGVGNVTWIGKNDAILAFDTGPGNALLDDWAKTHTGEPIDHDGKLAGSGVVDEAKLEALLQNPYFAAPPPKSLDRNAFSSQSLKDLSAADGAATLVAFTTHSIARAAEHFPQAPELWIIAGGGTRNPVLMEMLRELLPGPVKTADELGWSAEFLEAEAFAYLAVRSVKGLPLSFPGTTGVPRPTTGGVRTRGLKQS